MRLIATLRDAAKTRNPYEILRPNRPRRVLPRSEPHRRLGAAGGRGASVTLSQISR